MTDMLKRDPSANVTAVSETGRGRGGSTVRGCFLGVAALCAAFACLGLFADTSRVETARRDSMYNDSQVVTNVDLSGFATETYVQTVSGLTLDAAIAYFAANADYALTNLTGEAVMLRSGEIGNVVTNANVTLELAFADNGRSGDCLLYFENTDAANEHTITVSPPTLEIHGIGSDFLTAAKATTNLFMFSRVKENTVIVSKQEVE